MNNKTSLEQNQIAKYLEKIIFSKDELRELAKNITELMEGKISSDEYKTKLLESRVRILNDITEFSEFYIKSQMNLEPSGKQNDNQLEAELIEKTKLLEEIAKRLQKIENI
jgi:hypothetical protein